MSPKNKTPMTTKEIKKEIARLKKLQREAVKVENLHKKNISRAVAKAMHYEARAAAWRRQEQDEWAKKEKAFAPFTNARAALMAKLSPSELDKYMDHI